MTYHVQQLKLIC